MEHMMSCFLPSGAVVTVDGTEVVLATGAGVLFPSEDLNNILAFLSSLEAMRNPKGEG